MPETTVVSGILQVSGINSALAELGSAAGGLQTVLLTRPVLKPLRCKGLRL